MLHQFVSAKSDGADTALVRPSNWNAQHKGELYNYVFNGGMEIWGSGSAGPPTGWTLTGAGATAPRNATNFKQATFSTNLVRSGADCALAQRVDLIPGHGPASWWQGRTVTFGCWVQATVASRARLVLGDGVGSTVSATHTGGGAFEWITVTRTIDAAATSVQVDLQVVTGNTTAQFDGATLCIGVVPANFVPGGWQGRKCAIIFGDNTAQAQATTEYYGPYGRHATEVNISFPVPFKGVARNLRVALDTAPAAGQTYIETLRLGEGGSALTATVTSAGRTATNLTNEVEFSGGSFMSVESVASATAGSRFAHASIEYEEVP